MIVMLQYRACLEFKVCLKIIAGTVVPNSDTVVPKFFPFKNNFVVQITEFCLLVSVQLILHW